MLNIKVSSKRQVTFPSHVCESLGIYPGDQIRLDRKVENNREVWVLVPEKTPIRPWFGNLRKYAERKPHDMEHIRNSIAAKRSSEYS